MEGSYAGYGAACWTYQAAHAAIGLAQTQQQYQPIDPLALQYQQLHGAAAVGPSSFDQGFPPPYMTPNIGVAPPAGMASDCADSATYGAQYGAGYGTDWVSGGDADEAWYQDPHVQSGYYGGALQDSYEGFAYHTGGGGGVAGSGTRGVANSAATSSHGSVTNRRGQHSAGGGGGGGGGGGAAASGAGAGSAPPVYVGRVKESALVTRPAVEQLARLAPVWVVYYNYTVNGPSGQPDVLDADRFVQSHNCRRLHGHTMVVGLAAGMGMPPPPVPPAFLRPLVFLVALVRAGQSYTPVNSQQLYSGMPAPGWCVPGSLFSPRIAADASPSSAGASTSSTTAAGGANANAHAREPLARWPATAIDAAVRALLDRAPYWCLLTSYADSGRWQCPVNLTQAQVREKLRAGHGCLHACLLGCSERLNERLWIPTSMVLPLGALLQTVAAAGPGSEPAGQGLQYNSPNAADVRYYIEDAVRAVLGRPEAETRLSAYLRALPPPVVPAAAEGSLPQPSPPARLDPSAAVFVPPGQSRAAETADAGKQSGAGGGKEAPGVAATAADGSAPRGEAPSAVPPSSAAEPKATGATGELRGKAQESSASGPNGATGLASGATTAREEAAEAPAAADGFPAASAKQPRAMAAAVAVVAALATARAEVKVSAVSAPAAASPADAGAVAPATGTPSVESRTASKAQRPATVQQQNQPDLKFQPPTPQSTRVPTPASANSGATAADASERKLTYAAAATNASAPSPAGSHVRGPASAAAAAASSKSTARSLGGAGWGAGAGRPSQGGHDGCGAPDVDAGLLEAPRLWAAAAIATAQHDDNQPGTSPPTTQPAPQQRQQQQAQQQQQQQQQQRGGAHAGESGSVTSAGTSGAGPRSGSAVLPGLVPPAALPSPMLPADMDRAQQQRALQGQQQRALQGQQQGATVATMAAEQLHPPQPEALPVPIPVPVPVLTSAGGSQGGGRPPTATAHNLTSQQLQLMQQQQQQQLQQRQRQQQQPQAPAQPGGVLVPIPTPFVRFETAVFRLFQGDHGQHAFGSLWWYLDPATINPGASVLPAVLGPYSCEQMILAFIAQLLPNDAMLCGTQGTLAPPSVPPPAAFLPLGALLAATEDGHPYALLQVTPELPKPLHAQQVPAQDSTRRL